MNITDYISPELLILVPVLYLVGIGVKKTEAIKDKCIPLVLGGISIALSAIWVLASHLPGNISEVLTAIFTAVTQGVLIAGASVYANQIYKQSNRHGDE